jgi:hypothetical protein
MRKTKLNTMENNDYKKVQTWMLLDDISQEIKDRKDEMKSLKLNGYNPKMYFDIENNMYFVAIVSINFVKSSNFIFVE